MGFMAKVKQWFGIGGVTVDLQCENQISKQAGMVNGAVTLTSKSDLHVLTVDVSLIEEWTTGRGEDKETKDLELGKIRLGGNFDIKAGEELTCDYAAFCHGTVELQPSRHRIGQVIGNLVGNALRYIPSGRQIKISVQGVKEGVALPVRDNGPGIKETDLPHLFERFWRGEKSRARSSGGAGLGLAIAKQLIEAQGGHIDAQNKASGGLRVTFVLP